MASQDNVPADGPPRACPGGPLMNFNTNFREAYVQTRHKNLRCFPICSAVHMEKSFCGRVMDVSIRSTPSYIIPNGKPLVVGEFRCTATSRSFAVNEIVNAALLRDQRFIVGELVLSDPGELRFILNPNRKWFYPRTTSENEMHTYTVYFMMDGVIVSILDSPIFRVLPIWKEERRPSMPGISAGPKHPLWPPARSKKIRRSYSTDSLFDHEESDESSSPQKLTGNLSTTTFSRAQLPGRAEHPAAFQSGSPWRSTSGGGYMGNSGPSSYFNPHHFGMSPNMLNLMPPFPQSFTPVSSSMQPISHNVYPNLFGAMHSQPQANLHMAMMQAASAATVGSPNSRDAGPLKFPGFSSLMPQAPSVYSSNGGMSSVSGLGSIGRSIDPRLAFKASRETKKMD